MESLGELDCLQSECKQTLQLLLRPKYFSVIPPWIEGAKQADLKAAALIGSILRQRDQHEFRKTANSVYGLKRPADFVQQSLDAAQLAAFPGAPLPTAERPEAAAKARAAKISAERQGKVPLKAETLSKYCATTQCQYLSAAPFARMLHPEALQTLEEWQVFERSLERKCRVAQTLEKLFSLYTSMAHFNSRTSDDLAPHERLHFDAAWRASLPHSPQKRAAPFSNREAQDAARRVEEEARQAALILKQIEQDSAAAAESPSQRGRQNSVFFCLRKEPFPESTSAAAFKPPVETLSPLQKQLLLNRQTRKAQTLERGGASLADSLTALQCSSVSPQIQRERLGLV